MTVLPALRYPTIGSWSSDPESEVYPLDRVVDALGNLGKIVSVIEKDGALFAVTNGEARLGGAGTLVAVSPPLPASRLGDSSFCRDHGIRFPYVSGAMANGIGSVEIAVELARRGALGFFGAAGLAPERVERAIEKLDVELGELPYGVNLIHSPNEPELEEALAELLLRRSVRMVEASAYLGLTPAIVRYRLSGIRRGAHGRVVAPNRVVAKVSRVEVAEQFFSPAPERILRELVAAGRLTAEEAALAAEIPVAQDVTAEADSGGHTDNRSPLTLWPTLLSLRDRLQEKYGYGAALRVGAAGGISTPASAAAAFAMGAAYVLIGSVHQGTREAGTSDAVRELLAGARQADVTMAPAADMFEMGVKVQVLKRGTMFAMRGAKLYELYRTCDSLDAIPAPERARLEKDLFRDTLENAWASTRAFFQTRDPSQIERAERDPKHKMALVFRAYLGQASRWANAGLPERKIDYQVWCGPSMGAFNEWVAGSPLEDWRARTVSRVASNLLFGAAVETRLNALRAQGVPLPSGARVRPVKGDELWERLG
ncbi:MAG: 2-nitropropane dioxygenase [Elusimicrobia bacterium CG1_02_63_36]|nr:MAG: 2-nitropropane dioxygenase [Elusimicrobia bacterium CG1_02_63_36]PIP82239.1 MAG: 2-nitropropane dioxygenase [Elusimicrobia bacterium CG22_combo_CG10-13_8_21_14_all_63_91]PJA15342.1 MAG: 2-nitropropane dioxygenase [Elusimicrobia bacterium CG_4_10_14_0_2_um_filter_63_34]PJB26973.1 MAG: 2-nitropropane dioxygenase [Elusimicrobia bacterium CG_4_9_14_3_um_filter_62_55]